MKSAITIILFALVTWLSAELPRVSHLNSHVRNMETDTSRLNRKIRLLELQIQAVEMSVDSVKHCTKKKEHR